MNAGSGRRMGGEGNACGPTRPQEQSFASVEVFCNMLSFSVLLVILCLVL